MCHFLIKKNSVITGTIKQVPSSKSISNRALIINALSGNKSLLHNISSSSDTKLMQQLLCSGNRIIDASDAGTVMRFLTAYFAVTRKRKIITGTPRMKQRPIEALITALRKIGTEIIYLETKGYPPFEIRSFSDQKISHITIDGTISSQYVSALMMIAPMLPQGLTIHLQGDVVSRPYIDMTASVMRHFQVACSFTENRIIIEKGTYIPSELIIEPDWSAMSYWLAIVALAEKAEIVLDNVGTVSIQGDRTITTIMEKLGAKIFFHHGQAVITNQPVSIDCIVQNFIDCPDLAQTVIPVCALKGVRGIFTGMKSLRMKETDRISSLQKELKKIDAELIEKETGTFHLVPPQKTTFPDSVSIATYNDHRMAMGFAPWATQMNVQIENAMTVNKSYPTFWSHLKQVGFELEEV